MDQKHDETGETFTSSKLLERYGSHSIFKRKIKREGWLENIRKSITVFSISTSRLKTENNLSTQLDSSLDDSLMVSSIANEVRELIQNAIREQFEVGRKKETSFPTRLITSLTSGKEISKESVITSIEAVQNYEERFARLGLVPKIDSTKQLYNKTLSETAGMLILKTYLDDIKEKFDLLDDLAQRLDVFSRSINALITFKSVETSADVGIVVRSLDRNREKIPLSALSSGEQHLLVLIGKLVFDTKNDSLVLIDEPEISFHPEWQEKFLDIIDEIRKLSSFSVLIATHSPILIGDRWDFVTELAEQYSSKNNNRNE